MKSYQVSGTALQTFEWDIVVQAKDELDAKVVASQAVYTLYQETHRVSARTVKDVTDQDLKDTLPLQGPGHSGETTHLGYDPLHIPDMLMDPDIDDRQGWTPGSYD